MQDVSKVHEIVNAEVFVRRCYAKRQRGISFNNDIDRQVPVVDEWHRLVHYETGVAQGPEIARDPADRATPVPGADDRDAAPPPTGRPPSRSGTRGGDHSCWRATNHQFGAVARSHVQRPLQ